MFSIINHRRLVPLLLPLVLFAGCSSESGISVFGTVQDEKGVPISGAILEFSPLEATELIGGAVVQADEMGKFEIGGGGRTSTLSPGKYGVRVSKWVDRKTKVPPSAEDLEQLKLGGFLVNVLPHRYSDPESNPLVTVELKAGTNDAVKIEVKSR